MEYQVRDARVTDVDRITNLLDAAARDARERAGAAVDEQDEAPSGSSSAAELLRTMVYMPSAIVLVADAGRRIVGAIVVALRPSLRRRGMVGSIDVLALDRGFDPIGVMATLLKAALRSARNKGCVAIEAPWPADPQDRSQWEEQGFTQAGPRLVRSLAVPTPAMSR